MADYDSNPFADPNVVAETKSDAKKQTTAEELIDDFNPFAVDQFANQPIPAQQPAVLPPPAAPLDQPPPYTGPTYGGPSYGGGLAAPYGGSAATRTVAEDLQRRQEELDRKAADLDRREKEMKQTVNAAARIENFPPLPRWFPLKPCFYQDFNLDIPTQFQKIVKIHFYLWISYSLLMFINICGALASMIMRTQSQAGTTFGLSILYFILFTPCAFVCWYRPVYKAFRSDSSFNFFFYFFVFFIQFVANIIQCLGIDGSGTCGFINGIGSFNASVPVGTFMTIIGALYASCAAISIILLIRVHRIYRSSDASFSKAQQEFATGFLSNRTVQQTATGVATAAARGAAEQTFTDVRH